MKFLGFGDMHERPDVPLNRKDKEEFRDNIRLKKDEIREIGKREGVSAYLQAGDFLNSAKYDYEVLSKIISEWTPFNINKIMSMLSSGSFSPEEISKEIGNVIPMIGVAGNHELFGNSISSLPKTSINFLSEVGMLQFATKDNPIFFTTEDGLKIAITGTHYHINMDKEEFVDDYIVEEKLGDYHIHIVHGYLTNKSFGDLFRHTTVDQIASRTKADLTFAGHDHIGFGLTEVDGKYFINPGSPVRSKCDIKEMKRRPKVFIVDITREHGLNVKTVYLKSAKKGEDVLDRTIIEKEQEKQAKIQEIKSTVQKAQIKKGVDITEIIENISDNRQINEEWKNDIINDVTKNIQKMKPETHNFIDYWITDIILENFQSHKNTHLKCSENLNMFIGDSRQGKTSVLRALSWIYEDKFKDSRRLIHKEEDYARATIKLSNGYSISRIVERKKTGKNGYEIYDPNLGTTEYKNTKALAEVQEILGFTNLDIGTSKPIPLNFLKQGKGWFFIGDNITSTERAKIIGGIYGTHYVDAVVKEYDLINKRKTREIETRTKDLNSINEKISAFNHLEEDKKEIDRLELIYSKIEVLMEKKNSIEKIIKSKNNISQKIMSMEKTINALSDLSKTQEKIDKLKSIYEKQVNVKSVIQKRNEVLEKGLYFKKVIENTKNISLVRKKIDRLKELNDLKISKGEILETYQNINNKIVILHKKIDFYTDYINKTKNIESVALKIEKLKALNEAKEKICTQLEEYNKHYQNCKNLFDRINKIKLVIDETKDIKIIKEKLDTLNELLKKKESIMQIRENKSQLCIKANKIKEQREKAMTQNNTLIVEYKELLKNAGKCPVCHGTIDNAVINRIVEQYTIAN